MNFRNSYIGIKQWERKANHSPSSDAEVNNEWMFSLNPQYNLMMCRGTAFLYLIPGHEKVTINKIQQFYLLYTK